MRLRRVSNRMPGWTRVRWGKGWRFLDSEGRPLSREQRERVEQLAIPPAWTDVWISPYENGHLQATGVDAAGRTQYLYHPEWVHRRNVAKYERVVEIAVALPELRRAVLAHIEAADSSREHTAAVAVKLLDSGAFRVGNDVYADKNGSFGLTTLERRHVRARGDALVITFIGKSGVEHSVTVDDPRVVAALNRMRRRRGGGPRLLEYRAAAVLCALDSADVNSYLREQTGLDVTAKDLRTWAGTVIAAEMLALSEESGQTKRSRARAVKQAMVAVSEALGNTPTVARASYVDPRLLTLYEHGRTLPDAVLDAEYADEDERRHAIERATLELLRKAD
ncbi:DNA topoisomerase IB [Auraticoccus sp. F435]|uniref:DNA topoisomerase n=1 Tax=Auraticoccus cholistanensis TaxID=2656650 RepID=A0A6A9UUA4_9ACTN|nr:DNA topoisomerase IB [Auraticoccus cholistanensis]MVA75164.1 DNA topoisomerase IB [Auraticoccus cholistanensis]